MTRRLLVEVLAGPSVGETYEHREETILVGRGSNCQLQVSSPHVSRQQCELSWQGDQLVLENLGTVNVTYLNDRPIERVYVQDGDLITFCDVALRVRIPRAGAQKQDPDRTVAFPKDQVAAAGAGHPLPQPGSDATVVRSQPPNQDTHPPGPLGGPPPPGPPPNRPPPPGQPVPGALGTGMYGTLSGQHAAHQRPPGPPPGAPPPRSAPPPPPPPGMLGTQKFPAGLHLQPPGAAQIGQGPPAGMPPQRPGPPPGMPGSPPGMPGPPPGMPPQARPGMPGAHPGHPGAHQGRPGGPPQHPGAQSVNQARKKRKRKGKQGPNLPLIRNVVLVAAAIIVLLAFAKALTDNSGSSSTKKEPPTASAPPEPTPAVVVKDPSDPRTDEEIVREAQKLYGTGSTYLREYRIADENLWTAKEYMERARDELAIVPSEKWPPFAGEIEQKLAETEGLLDQEFRRLKLAYVREKSAGNYSRALEELERMQRIFPNRDDERHQFSRKQKKVLNKLMSGGGGGGIFGG